MKKSKISVQELQPLLSQKKPVFILDIRPEAEYEEWHIPESLPKDLYGLLKKGDRSAFDAIEIPEGIPVVTLCAAGRTSKIAADILNSSSQQKEILQTGSCWFRGRR